MNHNVGITTAGPLGPGTAAVSASIEASTGDATLDIIRRWDLLAEGALVPVVSRPELAP